MNVKFHPSNDPIKSGGILGNLYTTESWVLKRQGPHPMTQTSDPQHLACHMTEKYTLKWTAS